MKEWMVYPAVAGILAGAVYTDIKEGKIKNQWMLMGMVCGLVAAFAGNGVAGVLESIRMAGIILLALFILFLIKGLGAGDIKLFCVLALFFPDEIVKIVMASFFIGAALGIGKMVFRWIRKEPFYIRKETMNFSVPIAIGTGVIWCMTLCS